MADIPILTEIIEKEKQAILYNKIHADEIAKGVAEAAVTLSEDEFYKLTLNYIQSKPTYSLLRTYLDKFIADGKKYLDIQKQLYEKYGDIQNKIQNYEHRKNLIYENLFKLQNFINAFLGQEIVMTYVHVDETGSRQIRIMDNDIGHLMVTTGWARGYRQYAKLTYVVNEGYRELKNSLPEGDNKTLDETAKEVTRRYQRYKGNILWYLKPVWKGYHAHNLGPINEAYANLYIHDVKLMGQMEERIDTFMLDGEYGAIQADRTKGFLIGDVSKNGVQYAVKGANAGPQGFINVLGKVQDLANDFSPESLATFIKYFTYDELHKDYQSMITKLTGDTLNHWAEQYQL